MRILALGDLYTIGEGVSPAERWPVQLANRLRGLGLDVDEPAIIARTGWTTAELLAGMAAGKPAGPFDLVTLLIGVNNQYRGCELSEYRAQFRHLLRLSITLAGERPGRVLVLSIPDWSAAPFASSRGPAAQRQIAVQIDDFNQANRAEGQSAGVRYVDITPITRQKGAAAGWFAADGLHPAARMYSAWVELALPVVLEIIQE